MFFCAGTLAAFSQFLAPRLGVRVGLVRTNGNLAAPLVLAGSAKAAYDLLLLWRFRSAVLDHDRTP